MMKIDRIEFFRAFVVLEAALVGLPIGLYLLGLALLCLGGVLPIVALCVVPVLVVASFYFFVPALIAPGLIKCASPLPVLMPTGPGGWLLVVGMYSVVALVFALLATARVRSRKRRRPRAGRTGPASTVGASKCHDSETGDKSNAAT
jgi:hypothetical protein